MIPKRLFLPPLPSDMITVNACQSCNNNAKSQDDRYLMHWLVCDYQNWQHPVARRLFEERVRPRVREGKSAFAFDAMRGRVGDVHSPSGIIVGRVFMAEIPDERVTRTLSRIVRGLYYHCTKTMMPNNVEFEIRRQFNVAGLQEPVQTLMRLGGKQITIGNDEVFRCVYLWSPDHPAHSIWLLGFYNGAVFSVGTSEKAKQIAS